MKKLKKIFALCLLAVAFIAIPGWFVKMLFVRIALSPRVLPIWLDAGVPGYIFGFALPTLLFQILGMVLGFSAGIFIFSRFVSKQQMLNWMLEGKGPRAFSTFVRRIVELAYK